MNIEEIRLEVFKQTGKSIDPDDPFFVALAMLSATATGIEKKNDAALGEIRQIRDEIAREAVKNRNAVKLQTKNACSVTAACIIWLKIMGASAVSLSAGIFIGTKDISTALTGSLGLGLGVIVGIVLCFVMIVRMEKNYDDKISLVAPPANAELKYPWSAVMGSTNQTIAKPHTAGTNTERILAEREKQK